jgi:hypothetical protein
MGYQPTPDDILFIQKVMGCLKIDGVWIRKTEDINKALDEYRFNDAASNIYQFIWHEFCDWYLELTKLALYREGARRDGNSPSERF